MNPGDSRYRWGFVGFLELDRDLRPGGKSAFTTARDAAPQGHHAQIRARLVLLSNRRTRRRRWSIGDHLPLVSRRIGFFWCNEQSGQA